MVLFGSTILTEMDQRCITNCGPLRYSMLHHTPDLNYFIHPLALRRLALFLVEHINVLLPPLGLGISRINVISHLGNQEERQAIPCVYKK